MTPPARHAAAIEILDRILGGTPAETALTAWGRGHRFAGSGDRFAIRDLVFEALRRRASLAALGGAMTGRGLMLGLVRQRGIDPEAIFTGLAHAPGRIGEAETGRAPDDLEALDCPNWLAPRLQAALGAGFAEVMQALQQRAPTCLRVNPRRATPDQAAAALRAEGIETATDPDLTGALFVLDNARKINVSQAFLKGMVELQDHSSQAVIAGLDLRAGQKVLDYCAGSGGKALAMAGAADLRLFAHDALKARMQDLPARAARAGATLRILDDPAAEAPYDLVLCDAPCSGSGSWRRDPQGKWALTEARLAELCALQARILDAAAILVQPGGVLAYATCSLLREENEDQVAGFLARHQGWSAQRLRRLALDASGDGFFAATLQRPEADRG